MNNMIPKIKLNESYFIWLLDPGVAHSSLILNSVKLIMFIWKLTKSFCNSKYSQGQLPDEYNQLDTF